MRLFIYEFAQAQSGDLDSASELCAEGRAMLAAVVEDFARVAGIEPVTLLHTSCPAVPNGRIHWLTDSRVELAAFASLAARADLTLVIAPESGGTLAERCEVV